MQRRLRAEARVLDEVQLLHRRRLPAVGRHGCDGAVRLVASLLDEVVAHGCSGRIREHSEGEEVDVVVCERREDRLRRPPPSRLPDSSSST